MHNPPIQPPEVEQAKSDRSAVAGAGMMGVGRRPWAAALAMFAFAASVAGFLIVQSEQQRLRELRAHIANQAGDHAHAIQRDIERALSATYALAALVRQGNGQVRDLDATAREMLPYYPGASSLQLAPDGIVKYIVPLAGNEKAIGHNLLRDPARDREAFLARDSGKLTLAGPFNLIQGGLGAVGRLPVFLDDDKGNPSFWGFTTVLIRFPEVLNDIRLSRLAELGFAYELWRSHQDSGERQLIAASIASLDNPVNEPFDMPNGVWTLSVAPVEGWGDPVGLTLKVAIGLLFSLLLAYLAKLLVESRMHKLDLEILVERRTTEIVTEKGKLQATFDAIPDMVWLKDEQGVYLDCNPMFERFVGFGKPDIIGRVDYDLVGKDMADSFREHDRNAIAAGKPIRNEECLVFAEYGRRGVFEITKTPMRDADGKLVGVLGVAHDITEHQQLQRQLQDQQAHLENLVQQRTAELSQALDRIQKITSRVPGLVYQLRMHSDGRFSMPYVSGAIGGMFGLSPHDVREDMSPIFALVHPADRPGLLSGIRASAHDMDEWHHEFRIRLNDGSEHFLMGDAMPQQEVDGAVLWHGFITDITERKQAEAALQKSEQHYLAVAQSANDAIITTGSDGRIVGWNLSAGRMFGYAETEIFGQDIAVLMPQRFRARHAEGLARVAAGGETHMIGKTVELAGLRKDGNEFPLEISLAQYQSDEGWYCSAIIRDITGRKQAEQRLSELSAHLQNVREEEKARIAREIHDDLGGTLTALKMNTHWLEEELSTIYGSAVFGDYVKSMSQQLDEAVLATRRIITDLRPTILDDLGLLAALEWQADGFYKRTGIVCCVNCVENAGNVGQERSIALFRIFQEALTNIARHSGASTVEVDYHNDGHEIILTVSDNGRGMQEGQSIARTSYGIRGMRERIEQLGGEISFASPPDGGLSLTVVLLLPDAEPVEGQT